MLDSIYGFRNIFKKLISKPNAVYGEWMRCFSDVFSRIFHIQKESKQYSFDRKFHVRHEEAFSFVNDERKCPKNIFFWKVKCQKFKVSEMALPNTRVASDRFQNVRAGRCDRPIGKIHQARRKKISKSFHLLIFTKTGVQKYCLSSVRK